MILYINKNIVLEEAISPQKPSSSGTGLGIGAGLVGAGLVGAGAYYGVDHMMHHDVDSASDHHHEIKTQFKKPSFMGSDDKSGPTWRDAWKGIKTTARDGWHSLTDWWDHNANGHTGVGVKPTMANAAVYGTSGQHIHPSDQQVHLPTEENPLSNYEKYQPLYKARMDQIKKLHDFKGSEEPIKAYINNIHNARDAWIQADKAEISKLGDQIKHMHENIEKIIAKNPNWDRSNMDDAIQKMYEKQQVLQNGLPSIRLPTA